MYSLSLLTSLSLPPSLPPTPSLQLSARLDKAVAMSDYFETEMNKAHQVTIVHYRVYVNGMATIHLLAID